MRIRCVINMLIDKFVSSLLPSFGKDRVIEDIRLTRGELEELSEVYKEAADLLRGTTFKNKLVTDKFAAFKRIVGTGSDNMIVHISKNMPLVMTNINAIEKIAQTNLNNTVAARGLTFKQATIIQYADLFHFINRYARKILNYVYVMESSQYATDPLEAVLAITKPELQWLEDNFVAFCNAFKSATLNTEEALLKIEETPEAEVNETSVRTLSASLGSDKIDPLRLGFAGTWLNPIYAVRMITAEWQVSRYKAAKEELTALRLRRLQLEKQRQGKQDAKLELQIQYYEKRIQTLNYETAQMEKKYG